MDTAFKLPVVGIRVGWDPILGLIPGAGDLIATAVSAYVVFLAARFNLPKDVMGQMVFNVLLDMSIGAIPLLGDIFDAFYKSNVRNLALLETHLQHQVPEMRSDDLYDLNSVRAGDVATKV